MKRLAHAVFLLPWWLYLSLAGGIFLLGEWSYHTGLAHETPPAPPAVVDLDSFTPQRDVSTTREVHVTGWLNPDIAFELTRKLDVIALDKRYMYVMFPSSSPKGATAPGAVLLMTPKEHDYFLDHMEDFTSGQGKGGPELTINGRVLNGSFAPAVRGALQYVRLDADADYIMIRPFLHGRDAALAAGGAAGMIRLGFWLGALVAAVLGMARLWSAGRRAKPDPAGTTGPLPSQPAPAPVPEPVPFDDASPLARLNRKLDEAKAPAPLPANTPAQEPRRNTGGLLAGLMPRRPKDTPPQRPARKAVRRAFSLPALPRPSLSLPALPGMRGTARAGSDSREEQRWARLAQEARS